MSLRPALALSLALFSGSAFMQSNILAQQGGIVGPVTPADEARLAQFERSLDSLRQQYKIPGLSAAVVNNGRIVWERGYGFQDVENGIQATPATPYRIASLTKTFASMLLMKCVEQGNLNLDSPIINYTTQIPEPGVTVRHLFTHTSENPPGAFYRYNGNRFAALTPVVDACAGRPFRDALAKTILDRLEMWDSVPGQDMETPTPQVAALFTTETLQRYSDVIRRLAKPYELNSKGQMVLSTYPNRGISASAGLISTVRDLARYDAAIDNHMLLQPATQAKAWTNAVSNYTGQTLPYAHGWFAQTYRNERLIWHYGYWPTFSALILKVPGRNVTLILLANSDGLSAPFSNALGGAGDVTGSPFANLFLRMLDDASAFASNPIDQTPFFIRQHYRDFLNREPEPAGFEGWQNILDNCPQGSPACDRTEVSSAFFRSAEFQERGYFIYRFYAAALGRVPRYTEFMPDMARVSGFQSAEQQEASKRAFIDEFMARSEFAGKYGNFGDARAYVEALEQAAGVTLLKKAERLDPLSITISNGLGDYYFHKRQYDRSIEQHRKTLEIDPGYLSAHNGIGRAYEQKGMYREAIEEYRKASTSTDRKFIPAISGYAYALSGKREEAVKLLGRLIEPKKQTSTTPYLVAVIYAGLGKKDEAFKWLDKAFADHSLLPGPLRFDPRLDSLRDDARFRNLLERVGLPL